MFELQHTRTQTRKLLSILNPASYGTFFLTIKAIIIKNSYLKLLVGFFFLSIGIMSCNKEEFASVAKDFLNIPDLSDQKIARRFKEEPPRYDELLNRVIISYTPINPDKEETKKQEMLVTPNPSGDKVNNIIVVREISNRDSFLQKKMLWQLDKYFQVITTSQKKGQPEQTTIMKVSWNEDKN